MDRLESRSLFGLNCARQSRRCFISAPPSISLVLLPQGILPTYNLSREKLLDPTSHTAFAITHIIG
jgi:hypothetical protein